MNWKSSGFLRRPSPTGIGATIALVLAMTGAAFAAHDYVLVSTKQIRPHVLQTLRAQHGRRGAIGMIGTRGLQGRYGTRGPVGLGGPTGPTGTTGGSSSLTSGPGGPAGSAVRLNVESKAETNLAREPESVALFTLGAVKARFFCGYAFIFVTGGITGSVATSGRADSKLTVTTMDGRPLEAQADHVSSAALGSSQELIAGMVEDLTTRTADQGYVSAAITTATEVVYVDGYIEISPTNPNCTFHGSAYSIPIAKA